MKQFLMSLLGALGAIWISVLLGGLLFVMLIVGVTVAGVSKQAPPSISDNSILHIKLSGVVDDRQTPRDIYTEIFSRDKLETISLNTLVEALENAAEDDHINGVFLDCKGVSAGIAQLQTITNSLKKFKESGKWVYAYADQYSQPDYLISAVADSVLLNPVGMVDIHGLASQIPFFKGFLDKIGVEMQVVKVGTYKSAVEPYILDKMSEPNREQVTLYLSQIWGCLADSLAVNRNTTVEKVNEWANMALFSQPAEYLVENKIVDRLAYRHEVEDLLAELSDDDEPRLVNFEEYEFSGGDGKEEKHSHQIAVLYALGDITEDGDGGIASEKLVPQIMDLIEDDDIEALVLRVNSGGGSAFASEQIWEALEQWKSRTKKPFYVSMGDYAASGGYYISCGADKIYAQPVTITGSIGIFGMIPNLNTLLTQKLGVNFAEVSTNSGSMPNIFKPMTPEQRAAMQGYVDRGYELFTRRCAEGRGMSVDSIKAIAEGRVWDGMTAKRIGLVDELGSLGDAVAAVARELKLGDGEYYIKEYPKVELEWWEELYELTSKTKASIVAEYLGEAKPYYDAVKKFESMDPVQARMIPVEIR